MPILFFLHLSVFMLKCRTGQCLFCLSVVCLCGSLAQCALSLKRYQPGLGSIPRPGRINCFTVTGVHALRLISWTGERV